MPNEADRLKEMISLRNRDLVAIADALGVAVTSDVPAVLTSHILDRALLLSGQAVPMTGPLLVFLPSVDPIAVERVVALRDALPPGSVIVTGGEGTRAELLAEVEDEVLAEELRRRWGGNADTFTAKDIAEICVELEVDLTHKLLGDVLDTPLPMAAIRGFTVEEHKEVQAWAERFYQWAAIPTGENDAPKQPECLTRVLAFLEKGVIRVEAKPTDEAGIKLADGMGVTT